jgi:hypothetical protein
MHTDKKGVKPSSGAKGAQTDLNEEIIFSKKQMGDIEMLIETTIDHPDLMKFPQGSVFVCERRKRRPSMSLHMMRMFVGEHPRESALDFLMDLFNAYLLEGRDHKTNFCTIAYQDWEHWRELYMLIDTIYEDSANGIPDTELVSIACLQ